MEEIIKLRGHHILCLLGFRGLGYDEAFVENMTRVHSRVFFNGSLVKLTTGPDDICSACPKLSDGCGTEAGSRVSKKDASVLEMLSLKPGDVISTGEIYDRVATTISENDLSHICKRCKWHSLGYCTEGLGKLRSCQQSAISFQPDRPGNPSSGE